jgi:hypothetical protein
MRGVPATRRAVDSSDASTAAKVHLKNREKYWESAYYVFYLTERRLPHRGYGCERSCAAILVMTGDVRSQFMCDFLSFPFRMCSLRALSVPDSFNADRTARREGESRPSRRFCALAQELSWAPQCDHCGGAGVGSGNRVVARLLSAARSTDFPGLLFAISTAVFTAPANLCPFIASSVAFWAKAVAFSACFR